jgi:hypothetical protein
VRQKNFNTSLFRSRDLRQHVFLLGNKSLRLALKKELSCPEDDIKLGAAFDLAEAFKSRRGQAGNETMDPGGGILALEDKLE